MDTRMAYLAKHLDVHQLVVAWIAIYVMPLQSFLAAAVLAPQSTHHFLSATTTCIRP